MRRGIAVFFLVSVLVVAGKAAQGPVDSQAPVWMVEVLKVKPGMLGSTLGYLDDNWMRVRAEAKRQGAVLDYHRVADRDSVTSDPGILLLTEFKNTTTYHSRENLFASIRKQLPSDTFALIRPNQQSELYETVSTRVFEDYSYMDTARFRLLSKN